MRVVLYLVIRKLKSLNEDEDICHPINTNDIKKT